MQQVKKPLAKVSDKRKQAGMDVMIHLTNHSPGLKADSQQTGDEPA